LKFSQAAVCDSLLTAECYSIIIYKSDAGTLRLLKPWWAVLGSRYPPTMHTNYPEWYFSLWRPLLSFQSLPNSQDHAFSNVL